MALPSPTTSLATQVARLFFERQMSKLEIAAHLGISRFRVARLIDGALADGTVRIEYRDVPLDDVALAGAMEERFGLDLCAVAADGAGSPASLAAVVIDGLMVPGEVLGIAWGSTLATVVSAIGRRRDPSIEVVQLAGSSARLEADHDAAALVRSLAVRLGGSARALYAPTFVESADVRDALLREPDVRQTTDRYAAVSMAVVGIGAMPAATRSGASSLLRSGVLDAATVDDLVDRGAVGDLVVHPFDRDGRFIAPDVTARAVVIDVDRLRAIRRVIAVASGPDKVASIGGALASGVVGVLVTDASTARAVLASAS